MGKYYKESCFEAPDGSVINYAVAGKPDGDAILLVHGWQLQGKNFAKIGRELVENHYVIWLDLRGHGKTKSRGPFTIEMLANDVRLLIEHLNLQTVTLVGYSLGGHVLFQYVKDFGCLNLKRAAVIDMTPKMINDDDWHLGLYQGQYREENYQNDLALLKSKPYEFFGFFMQELITRRTPSEKRDYQAPPLMKAIQKLFFGIPEREYWTQMCSHDYRQCLPEINVPMAIIYARPGSIYEEATAQYINSQVPYGRLYPVDESTHFSLMAKAGELQKIINDFISTVK